ncbi:unnamed protein product, partial [marine sediment metagenome]
MIGPPDTLGGFFRPGVQSDLQAGTVSVRFR